MMIVYTGRSSSLIEGQDRDLLEGYSHPTLYCYTADNSLSEDTPTMQEIKEGQSLKMVALLVWTIFNRNY